MALLDQLFGTQQPQDSGGLVQNILSQRFQPTPQDASQATYQSVFSPAPVSSYTTQMQRMGLPIQMAIQLGGLEKTGAETQGLNLSNQMQAFQMPYMQEMYKQMYGGGQDNGQPPVGFPPPQVDPRLKEARMAAMMGNKALSEADMGIYNADPNVITQKKAAEETGTNQAAAEKGVVGIDSRLQNAINILNDQIQLAPKTYAGGIGKVQEGMERNSANMNPKGQYPNLVAQTQFSQNNANLFTQELPAIMQGMPGSRMDIPLINAIKNASQIDEYAAPAEKIAAAQNLKNLLAKYQKNTHNYATGMGAPNTPIQPVEDANPQGNAASANGLDESDPRIQAARGHGYSDDEIRQFLMKGKQ